MTSMGITFSDDAFDAYVRLAANIPDGYTVSLLADGQEPTPDLVEGVDVRFISADDQGVTYEVLDPGTQEPYPDSVPQVRTWDRIARIHIC